MSDDNFYLWTKAGDLAEEVEILSRRVERDFPMGRERSIAVTQLETAALWLRKKVKDLA